jgi:HTH-type transcriptional regulator, sugar sensing transcriptional regulator
VDQDTLIETLQGLGFSQYEAQCYLGLLRQHPLNGSQLSVASGVPRSMVYQALSRLEEKAVVVRLHGQPGEPQQYAPVAPKQVIARRAADFQQTCERVEDALDALATTPPAEVVLNVVGGDAILQRATTLIRQAKRHVSVMAAAGELSALEPALSAAAARGDSLRVLSVGSAPMVAGQVVSFLGENVSAPTRFLILIADAGAALLAAFPPGAAATGVLTENPILVRLFSAFLNTEYYLVRLSNERPKQVRQMLAGILEPEDRPRYAPILRELERLAAEQAQQTEPARG